MNRQAQHPVWRRRLLLAGFTLYAAVLVTATHWPRLRIQGPVVRTDLYMHVGAFFVWTSLLIATELTGPWRRARSTWIAVAVALGYAALDEGTQAIPALGRTFGLDDLAADGAGVLLAGGLARALASLGRRAGTARVDDPTTGTPMHGG
jgi:VanZ family protein